MVWGLIPTISIPISVAGLGIIILSNRNMAHIRDLKDDAKTYLWNEEYVTNLAVLLCLLQSSSDISSELEYVEGQAEEDSGNPADDPAKYSDYIGDQIHFLADMRTTSLELRGPLNDIWDIDEYYEDIPNHRRNIGGAMIIFGVISLILYALRDTVPNGLAIEGAILFIAVIVIAHQVIKHERKKSKIERIGKKSERDS